MLRITAALAAAFALTAFGSAAQAGEHSDALGKCLERSIGPKDRDVFVVWMFSALSAHPAVPAQQRISESDAEAAGKGAADLMVRLMTVDCRRETVAVMAHEGMSSFGKAFESFGQTAGEALMTHPAVDARISGIARYVDESKFEGLQKDLAAEMRK